MKISGESCLLRPWRRGDEESLARHADNYLIWRNVRDDFPHPYTREKARDWISTCLRQERPVSQLAVIVDGEAAGAVGMMRGRDIYRCTAEIGYWLGEQHWGNGIMTEAARLFTGYVFEQFPIERLYGWTFDFNPASARVLEKAGYFFEAKLQCSAIKEGRMCDQLLYAQLRRRESH